MTNWRNKINIKTFLSDDTSEEAVESLCNIITSRLLFLSSTEERLFNESKNDSLQEDYYYEITDELDRISGNFMFVKDLIDGTIKKENWKDYDYSGEYLELFNEYLDELFDLGDTTVLTKNNVQQKFLWVG